MKTLVTLLVDLTFFVITCHSFQVPSLILVSSNSQSNCEYGWKRACTRLSASCRTEIGCHSKEASREDDISRKDFFRILGASSALLMSMPSVEAFEGGVGGLGKTKPETGVVFANPDVNVPGSTSTGEYNAELLSPDGTPAFLSFYAPWPLMRSAGIESRDLANPEASFVQVAPLPNGKNLQADNLPASFFTSSIFSPSGKFGAYSAPLDIKIKKVDKGNAPPSTSIYSATFTTLTPSMRGKDNSHFEWCLFSTFM